MHKITRRTAVGAGVTLALTGASTVASALPGYKPGPALPGPSLPGPVKPSKPYGAPATSPITAVDADGQGLDVRLAFTGGRTATLSDQERTRDLTLRQVPISLVISNTGSVPLARGITLEVRSAVLDATGLVTGPRQPILVSGLENNVRTWLALSQQPESSRLTLLQPLPPGSQLTVDLRLALAGTLDIGKVPQIQLGARAVLVTAAYGYDEVQAPEQVLTRL